MEREREKGWRSVNIKKINVKDNYRLQLFKNKKKWKDSHKTLKLNWKGFGLGLIMAVAELEIYFWEGHI